MTFNLPLLTAGTTRLERNRTRGTHVSRNGFSLVGLGETSGNFCFFRAWAWYTLTSATSGLDQAVYGRRVPLSAMSPIAGDCELTV